MPDILAALTEIFQESDAAQAWSDALAHAWNKPSPFDPESSRIVESYHSSLTVRDLLRIYRTMVLSRRMDERELILQKQSQCWFTISGAGKEAVLSTAALVLRPTDPALPYYRDRAFCLMRGVTPYEMLLQATAAAADPASGGRQMPSHWGHGNLNIVSVGSPTGAHLLTASGLAEAIAKTAALIGQGRFPNDAVVYASLGDATTSEGEFYEALKNASLTRAPVIFLVEDDGYGISVPLSEQVPGEDIAYLWKVYPDLLVIRVDGTSIRESYDAFLRASEYTRSRRGPVLVHAKVSRLMSHSSTDDQEKYRTRHEMTCERERDPILKFLRELLAYGICGSKDLMGIVRACDDEVQDATAQALHQPKTDTTRLTANIYRYDPASSQVEYARRISGRRSEYAGQPFVMADALNYCLDELMGLDSRIVMWGEDIADFSRRNYPYRGELSGKGGVFGITKGLQKKHGPDRVFNAPIAEATIVGKGTGYSLQGFKPVVEIQFRDYLNPAWQQLVDQAATLSFRSDGHWFAPQVIRMAYGGYLGGAGALWHSESAAGALLHYPGLRVCVPSNPRDAVGLMRAAVTCEDIVCFLEPKALYRRKDDFIGAKGEFLDQTYPDLDYVCWPGRARSYGDGKDLAMVTYGNMAPRCFRVMKMLAKEGFRVRVLDLLWLNPLDTEAILAAAETCGRVLIVDEDRRTSGAGAAIADVIYRNRDLRRRTDVERVAALDCRVSYGPWGERAVLPDVEDILKTAKELLTF